MERVVTGAAHHKGKLSLLKLTGDKKIRLFRTSIWSTWSHVVPDLGQRRRTASDGVGHASLREGEDELHAARQRGRRAGNVDFGWDLQKNDAADVEFGNRVVAKRRVDGWIHPLVWAWTHSHRKTVLHCSQAISRQGSPPSRLRLYMANSNRQSRLSPPLMHVFRSCP